MMKTVKEVSDLAGVSIRTLHYYDEINLLKPNTVTESGYRLYMDEDLFILQQILLFRELSVSLKDIKKILDSPDYDKNRVLECQKRLLCLKRNRLNHLISQIDNINTSTNPNDFKIFDTGETEWELIWNEIYNKQGEVQSEVLPTVKDVVEIFKKEKIRKILDLGCGTGRHSIFLAQSGFDVTASDISERGLEVTKLKAKKNGLRIETVCNDMREISFKDQTFDAVVCTWVSGHGTLEDMKRHANEMMRVVRNGGIVFVDYQSKEDEHYGIGIEIEENTFINNMQGEEKIPHHYTDEEEILEIYKGYNIDIQPYKYSFYDKEKNVHYIRAYIVICRK